MRSKLGSALCVLFILLPSCSPAPQTLQTTFYIYRFDPPAFVEFSENFQQMGEMPYSIPPTCAMFDVFPAPVGKYLLIELSCPNGQTVLFLDTSSSLPYGHEVSASS